MQLSITEVSVSMSNEGRVSSSETLQSILATISVVYSLFYSPSRPTTNKECVKKSKYVVISMLCHQEFPNSNFLKISFSMKTSTCNTSKYMKVEWRLVL